MEKENIDIYRKLIEHENILTNHRLSWFMAMQGLLLAGLAAIWDKGLLPALIFCFIGFITCIPFWYVLRLNHLAISNLNSECREENKGKDPKPPIIGYAGARHIWLLPWLMVPKIFLIAWVLMCFARLN